MAEALATPPRVIWARNGAVSTACPKSYITAQSLAWVEKYLVRWRLGEKGLRGLGVREVEAFLILERQISEAARAERRG